MLTSADKRLLAVVILLAIAALGLSLLPSGDEETIWEPEGLYILAYASTPFLQEELPDHVKAFTAETGIDVNVILTTDMNQAFLRAAVDKMPIDGIMVPYDMREEFRRAGRVIDLHKVIDEFPSPDLQTELRWLWSSIDGLPVCGFLIGRTAGDPTFACIWHETSRAKEVAELIRYLVIHTDVWQGRLVQPNHFARKLLLERDYAPLYNDLLHPSERQRMSLESFARTANNMCPGGTIENVRVVWREQNAHALRHPITEEYYDVRQLVQHTIEYDCIREEYARRQTMFLIEIKDAPLPSIYIPFSSFHGWPIVPRR